MREPKFNSLSCLRRLLAQVENTLRSEPEPEDAYAFRTSPLRRPLLGRSGAAGAELDEA